MADKTDDIKMAKNFFLFKLRIFDRTTTCMLIHPVQSPAYIQGQKDMKANHLKEIHFVQLYQLRTN